MRKTRLHLPQVVEDSLMTYGFLTNGTYHNMTDASEIKIAILQTKMDNFEKKVDDLDRKMDVGFSEVKELIVSQMKDIEETKANKWVEKTLIFGVSAIAGSLLLALMNSLLK